MDAILKQRLLGNHFVTKIRLQGQCDEAAYADLCGAIRQLRHEWAGQTAVDKEVVQDLFALPMIVRGARTAVPDSDAGASSRLEDMEVELEGLILDALSS